MPTKTDLQIVWTKWTGDDIAEVRHRIRALSEDGLLPRRKEPLSYTHLARALLGFTAALQHKDASAAVRSFEKFRRSRHRFLEQPNDQAVLLVRRTLLEALVASLQPPLRITALEVDMTSRICLLTVAQKCSDNKSKEGSLDVQVEYTFGRDNGPHRIRNPIYPMHFCRKIYSPLIDRLLTDLMNHPAMPGSVAKERPAKVTPRVERP